MGLLDEIAGGRLLAQTQASGWADTIDKAARTPQSHVVMAVAVLTVLRVAIYAYTKNVPKHQRFGGYKFLQFLQEGFDAIVYAGIFVFLIIRPYFVQAFRIPSGSMVSTLLVNDFIVANKLIYRYTDPKEGDIVVFRPPVAAVLNDHSQQDPDGEVNVDFIKRCIGVPGDIIEVKDDVLYRNGKAVEEPYKHFTQPTNPEQTLFREESAEEHATDTRINFKLVHHARPAGDADPSHDWWPVYLDGNLVNNDDHRTAAPFLVTGNNALADELRAAPPAAVPPGYYLMIGDNRNGSYDGRSWGLVPRADIVGRAEWIWLPLSRFGGIKSK